MAKQKPFDQTGAEAVDPSTGFLAGDGFDATLRAINDRVEADSKKAKADEESTKNANEALQSELDQFLDALKRALGNSVSQTHFDASLSNSSLENVSNTVTVTGSTDGYAEFTAKDGSSTYHVTPDGVFHDDADTNVSPEEAYNSAILVSNIQRAHAEGVTISGNDQQKYMYYLGLQEANKSLTPPLKLNNEAEILAIDLKTKAQAEQEFKTFLNKQAEPEADIDDFEIDLTSPEISPDDDIEETPETSSFTTATEAHFFTPDDIAKAQAGIAKYIDHHQAEEASKLHVEGTVKAEFGEEWTAGVEIEEPQAHIINDPSLPDDIIAIKDKDGNLQMLTTDPAAREEAELIARAETLESELIDNNLPEDVEVTALSDDDRAELIRNAVIKKGVTPISIYEELASHIKETGVATNKTIRSFLEEKGVPSERINNVTKDAVSRINKEDFIRIVPQGAAYKRVVNLQEDFTQAANNSSALKPVQHFLATEARTPEQMAFNRAVLGDSQSEESPIVRTENATYARGMNNGRRLLLLPPDRVV